MKISCLRTEERLELSKWGGKKINQPASKTNKTQTKKTKPNLDTVQQGLRISK